MSRFSMTLGYIPDYTIVLCAWKFSDCKWTAHVGKALCELLDRKGYIYTKERVMYPFRHWDINASFMHNESGKVFRLVFASDEGRLRGYAHGETLYVGYYDDRGSEISPIDNLSNCAEEFIREVILKNKLEDLM